MSAYKIGDRVVCSDSEGRLFVGAVLDVYDNVDLLVSDGVLTIRRMDSEIRPAMPRDRHDVDRDRWWWRNGRPVWVTWTASGVVWSPTPGWPHGWGALAADDWRGPVAPPPEVRS